MQNDIQIGDFLVFQLESAFGLLRVLGIDAEGDDVHWHLATYSDFFADVAAAEAATSRPELLSLNHGHVALTNRAFEGTQVAKLVNVKLTDDDLAPLGAWRKGDKKEVSDRSIRLVLGLR